MGVCLLWIHLYPSCVNCWGVSFFTLHRADYQKSQIHQTNINPDTHFLDVLYKRDSNGLSHDPHELWNVVLFGLVVEFLCACKPAHCPTLGSHWPHSCVCPYPCPVFSVLSALSLRLTHFFTGQMLRLHN